MVEERKIIGEEERITEKTQKVTVMVRIKPKTAGTEEYSKFSLIKPHLWPSGVVCFGQEETGKVLKRFDYCDGVIAPQHDQIRAYNLVIPQLLDVFLKGFDCSILAYGQTGSGKTHTIFGPTGSLSQTSIQGLAPTNSPLSAPLLWGLFPRAMLSLLYHLKDVSDTTLHVSAIEIYANCIYDLLCGRKRLGVTEGNAIQNKKKAEAEEKYSKFVRKAYHVDSSKFEIGGEQELGIKCPSDVAKFSRLIESTRTAHKTGMNERSSRSHCIVTVKLNRKEGWKVISNKFIFVDLAGSERIKKSGVEDIRRREACNVNTSLTALGRCISAQANKSKYVPIRDSTLTMMMNQYFGGSSYTLMMVNISLDYLHSDESLASLRFGERTAQIMNRPTKRIRNLHKEISDTEELLEIAKAHLGGMTKVGMGGGINLSAPLSIQKSYFDNKRALDEAKNRLLEAKHCLLELRAKGKTGSQEFKAGEIRKTVNEQRIFALEGLIARMIVSGLWKPPTHVVVMKTAEIKEIESRLAHLRQLNK